MWAYFCWLQISWVCRSIFKTMPSCPGLTPTLHSTVSLTAGSVEYSPLHQGKASRGGHLHFKEKTFSKSVNTFNNSHMRCLFFIWRHLPTLKWTGATLCTLTMDIMWLLILNLIVLFLLFAPCICNCVTKFVSSRMKAFKLQIVAQTPATATAASNYYLGPLDQISSIWRLRKYVASPI